LVVGCWLVGGLKNVRRWKKANIENHVFLHSF
jgi:hypothetical protein